MKHWASRVIMLNPTNYRESVGIMLKTMLKHYDEADLARYINSAKASPSTGGLATHLQSALFAQWRQASKSTDSIATMLNARLPTANRAWAAQRDNNLVATYARYLTRHPLA